MDQKAVETPQLDNAMGKAANFISWEQVGQMLDYCDRTGRHRDRAIILLAASTGYRHCDWGGLSWQDILGKEEVKLTEQKTGKRRTTELPVEAQTAFGDLFAAQKIRDPKTRIAKPRSNNAQRQPALTRQGVRYILSEVARAVGIEHSVSAHSLRKAFARRVFDVLGADEKALITVSQMLNHSKPRTTYTYLGLEALEMKRAYAGLFSK